MTFFNFASVEYNGSIYMTPGDFLQSIVDDKPRCKFGGFIFLFILIIIIKRLTLR